MSNIYKYCPNCKFEIVSEQEEPETKIIGNDGFGQPVRFDECDCGRYYGWFNLDFYDEFEFDNSFRTYLKSRVSEYEYLFKSYELMSLKHEE